MPQPTRGARAAARRRLPRHARSRPRLLALALAAAVGRARAAYPPPLAVADSLFSWHAPGGWDTATETWDDASGNGRHAVASAVPFSTVQAVVQRLTAPAGERGAAKAFPYLAGSKGQALQFGADPLPANFTVCSVTRVPEVVDDAAILPTGAIGAAASGNRVLASTDSLWVHGHDRGLSGVAGYNQATYKTGGDSVTGLWSWANPGDWLWMCASNEGTLANANSPCTVFVNGDAYIQGSLVCQTRGGSAAGVLAINAQADSADPHHAPGVWAVAEVIVWSRWLSAAELRRVLLNLQQRYGFAASTPAPSQPPQPPPGSSPPAAAAAAAQQVAVPGAPPSSMAVVAGLAICASLLALAVMFAVTTQQLTQRRSKRARLARSAFAYDVFMSYRHVDFAVVESVADKLHMEGLRVFRDRGGHMSGRPFDRELLRALNTSACFTPVITVNAMARLAGVGASDLDYTLVEYVLALHFVLTGSLKLLYPLMVGEEEPPAAGTRPRWDVLWANARFKAARDALPDTVPTATLDFTDGCLRAELGPSATLHSALRSATVRQLMCARAGDDSGFTGLLMHDACSLTGLQEDAELYIRHRYAANIKSLVYGQPPGSQPSRAATDDTGASASAGTSRYDMHLSV